MRGLRVEGRIDDTSCRDVRHGFISTLNPKSENLSPEPHIQTQSSLNPKFEALNGYGCAAFSYTGRILGLEKVRFRGLRFKGFGGFQV